MSDITYMRTGQDWSYLAVVLELFSMRIVGWTLSQSLATEVRSMPFKPRCVNDALQRGLSGTITEDANTRARRTAKRLNAVARY